MGIAYAIHPNDHLDVDDLFSNNFVGSRYVGPASFGVDKAADSLQMDNDHGHGSCGSSCHKMAADSLASLRTGWDMGIVANFRMDCSFVVLVPMAYTVGMVQIACNSPLCQTLYKVCGFLVLEHILIWMKPFFCLVFIFLFFRK